MKKALLLLTLFAGSMFSAGCETAQTNTAASKGDADVITGSRIPRRGGGSDGAVGTVGGEAYKQGQIERSGNTGMKGN
ncbi:MAG TPA: hypothetical protein VM051_08385 [Usitatibacter sp.]|nr:hypothetical protein [Usitatibacter sp.]